ncbi:MAG: sensor domain-containing diguanylate cyclase [Candidatus Methylumidiphilus sp.]
MIKPQPVFGEMQTITTPTGRPIQCWVVGILLFLALGLASEWQLYELRQEQAAERKAAQTMHLEAISNRLEGELNAVLYLSNGVSGHWAISKEVSNNDGTHKFFTDVFRLSRHVRSFAIAEGSRISFAYPPDDDGQVIDYDFKNQASQWPLLQHGIDSHTPLLTWSDNPARRLAYLIPIFKEGQFWGLLSTLIDESSLFSAAGLSPNSAAYEYALRGKNTVEPHERPMLGSASLFDEPEALVSSIAIPGGRWQLAIKPVANATTDIWPLMPHLLGWAFAALFSAMTLKLMALNRKLSDMALYDRLTGLPSRHLFLDRLKQVIRRTKRNHGNFSILFINLNEFKSINEMHGAKVGDMMLAGIGQRIIGFIRHCDTVTRWDGDEFLILLDDCPHDQATIIAANLRHQIELPVYCGEHKLRIGASIGLATFPDDGHSLSALLKSASTKMAKDKGLRKI